MLRLNETGTAMKRLREMSSILWVLCTTLLLSACSVDSRPDWVERPPTHYSNEQYLTASAQGDTQQISDNQALANLAKVFQVSIAESSVDFSEATVKKSGTTAQFENQQRVSKVINTQALQQLRGARIAEHWQEHDTSKFTSLAVMEKAPAAAAFTSAINDADEATKLALKYASDEAPNPLLALNALEKARQRQVTRLNDNNNLRVVSGEGIHAEHSVAMLSHKIDMQLAHLLLQTQTEQQLEQVLESSAAKVGVNIVPESQYKLAFTLEKQAVEQKQSWYWLRGSLVLSVLEKDKGISELRKTFKISAQDPALLNQRLDDKLTKQLPNYIYELLTPSP